MAKYAVYGLVSGTKYLGEFEADNKEDAIDAAMQKNGSVSVCHQCSDQIGDAEIIECIAEEMP